MRVENKLKIIALPWSCDMIMSTRIHRADASFQLLYMYAWSSRLATLLVLDFLNPRFFVSRYMAGRSGSTTSRNESGLGWASTWNPFRVQSKRRESITEVQSTNWEGTGLRDTATPQMGSIVVRVAGCEFSEMSTASVSRRRGPLPAWCIFWHQRRFQQQAIF